MKVLEMSHCHLIEAVTLLTLRSLCKGVYQIFFKYFVFGDKEVIQKIKWLPHNLKKLSSILSTHLQPKHKEPMTTRKVPVGRVSNACHPRLGRQVWVQPRGDLAGQSSHTCRLHVQWKITSERTKWGVC